MLNDTKLTESIKKTDNPVYLKENGKIIDGGKVKEESKKPVVIKPNRAEKRRRKKLSKQRSPKLRMVRNKLMGGEQVYLSNPTDWHLAAFKHLSNRFGIFRASVAINGAKRPKKVKVKKRKKKPVKKY